MFDSSGKLSTLGKKYVTPSQAKKKAKDDRESPRLEVMQ
jgi:hypothetical protein